jgi:hypothetical protein
MNDEITALSEEWDSHKTLPFPDAPGKGSQFNDLFPQLVEFDGSVAGMVSAALTGKAVDKNDISRALAVLNDFFLKLNAIIPLDRTTDKYRSSINDRLESLHRLVEGLLRVAYS